MSILPVGRAIRRETLVTLLQAALESGEYRFARQAALPWLAAFPGDLEVSLLQIQAIHHEARPESNQDGRVLSMLDALCRKDPFYLDAYRVIAQASQADDPLRYALASTSLFALGSPLPGGPVDGWGEPLRKAMLALAAGQYSQAEASVQEALRFHPDLLLAAVVHLLVDRATQEPFTTHHLAQIYHSRWPDCLPVNLVLAESHLELGNEPEAVELLHLCAANDATGQSARRLWGEQHAYRTLWPEDLAILFDLPIPAGVAGRLGWNRLAPGQLRPADPQLEAPPSPVQDKEQPDPANMEADDSRADTSLDSLEKPIDDILWPETASVKMATSSETEPEQVVLETEATEETTQGGLAGPAAQATEQEGARVSLPESRPSTAARRRKQKPLVPDTTHLVSKELDLLAKKLNQTGFNRLDGRFPIYVILSAQEGLINQYGPHTALILQNEMRKLAAAVRQRPGWGSVLYLPDDAACTDQFGLTPVNARDPWKVKNALADLDIALRKRGEMIGALLIVGGDEVVPFHRLPNPTDDMDGEVLSDSPYATLDANYFVPEWPVGRLPGEKGPDAALLLEQLRHVQRYHERRVKARPQLGGTWLGWFSRLVERLFPPRNGPGFGYTAAVWRRSSLAVFRPVSAPHTVTVSPPDDSGSVDRERIILSGLGYYNLHGLEDSPAWYGQRDPLEPTSGPDYPVALAPETLKRNGHAPRVVFSEACYGAHILGKSERDSLALKFLSLGTLAVVGSTCTAYGSLNTPLIAADLLGNLFWQHLKAGRTAGEALMQSKLDLVCEMNRRQGFLDGEDQKTLISFVLYGDPLSTYDGFRISSKVYRTVTHPAVKTVPDQVEESLSPSQLSGEILEQVKGIVADYLPGAEVAQMHFSRQSVSDGGGAKPAANEPGRERKNGKPAGGRIVVTVSKQVQAAEHIHVHTMRVTLDEAGKAVKLSISR